MRVETEDDFFSTHIYNAFPPSYITLLNEILFNNLLRKKDEISDALGLRDLDNIFHNHDPNPNPSTNPKL
jgi:hypothetical protein